jgi:hypothetical protein
MMCLILQLMAVAGIIANILLFFIIFLVIMPKLVPQNLELTRLKIPIFFTTLYPNFTVPLLKFLI